MIYIIALFGLKHLFQASTHKPHSFRFQPPAKPEIHNHPLFKLLRRCWMFCEEFGKWCLNVPCCCLEKGFWHGEVVCVADPSGSRRGSIISWISLDTLSHLISKLWLNDRFMFVVSKNVSSPTSLSANLPTLFMLFHAENLWVRTGFNQIPSHQISQLHFTQSIRLGVDHLSSSRLSVMMAKEKPPITVVGDVGGRIAIIVVRSQVYIDACIR